MDYDYVVGAARLAKECGVMKFSLVSALGANPDMLVARVEDGAA